MAAPTTPKPAEFNQTIVEASDTLAVAFVKVFIRFPVLLYRWYFSWYALDGSFQPEFKAKICAALADCPEDPIT